MRRMDSSLNDRITYGRLLRAYVELPAATSAEDRWTWLMALHVAGQGVLRLHWDSHVRMLALARATGDRREVAGQLLRLVLVPLGHLLQRLPRGNVGRATVSAFRPMEPPAEVRMLVARFS
jgi:hypothetical protein